MSELVVLPIGILIGILVSAPVGPANIICIERAVRYGFLPAFIAGIGASVGDAILATIAASGFEAAEDLVLEYSQLVRVVGGVVLIVFGGFVIRSHPHIERGNEGEQRPPLLRGAAASFAVTVTNPGALLAFAAFFSGMAGEKLMHDMSRTGTVLLILSVFGGALLWWLGVSTLVNRLRDRFSDGTLHKINVVSGSILICLGIAVLGGALVW